MIAEFVFDHNRATGSETTHRFRNSFAKLIIIADEDL